MYVIKKGYILENREKNRFYICNSCKTYIDREEMPKKCLKDNFSFANFPSNLIQKLKKKCQIRDDNISSHFSECQEAKERRSLKLNRLEAFLITLVIPFIQIAY